MGESLIQQYYMRDEGNSRKSIALRRIMTLLKEEVPANFVPAAAVIRRGRVLLIITGRKGYVDGLFCLIKKFKLRVYKILNTCKLE
jgi:hypothetical protein